MLTMRHSESLPIIPGRNSRVMSMGATELIAIVCWICATSSVSQKYVLPRTMPALLNRTSTGPTSSSTSAEAPAIASASDTSTT